MIMRLCNVQTNEYDLQAKTYPTICTHHKLHNTNENKSPVFPNDDVAYSRIYAPLDFVELIAEFNGGNTHYFCVSRHEYGK